MAIYRLLENSAFGPDEINVMGQAYEAALLALSLDRKDPKTEVLARRIISIAQTGERDAKHMCELAIARLGTSAE